MSLFQIISLAITVIRTLNSLSSGEQTKAGKQIKKCCDDAKKRDGRWIDDVDGA